jgi:hypothetical protein
VRGLLESNRHDNHDIGRCVMTPQEKARALRPLIEKAAASLPDKDASTSAELFPRMKYDGSLIEYQTRINWQGRIKKAAANLYDTEMNDPDHAPNLWTDIQYRDGYRIIPEVISAADAFSKDEIGWWGDDKYRSKQDGNVWTPAVYPAAWELV